MKNNHPTLAFQDRRQQGVVLLIALIALVAMTLAAIALLRAVDTGNVISGNLAFRQASLQATDIGVEAAFNRLPIIIASSREIAIANEYYPTRQAIDSKGIPTAVVWASVPCRDNTGATVDCSTQAYQVKYVIDRLCEGPTPVADILGKCSCDVGSGGTGSKGGFSPVFSSATAVYYRVTVQATGPRNTRSYVQAILSRGG